VTTKPDRFRQLSFCPCCFATEETGSWDHVVTSGYCMNCGNGSCVTLPPWAVDSIREQASWVGKRYYPHREDHERNRELRSLRKAIGRWPGRTVESLERIDEPDRAWVHQELWSDSEHATTSTICDRLPGESDDELIKRTAASLPVVLEDE
jgi:hypothetical protein